QGRRQVPSRNRIVVQTHRLPMSNPASTNSPACAARTFSTSTRLTGTDRYVLLIFTGMTSHTRTRRDPSRQLTPLLRHPRLFVYSRLRFAILQLAWRVLAGSGGLWRV